MSDVALAAIALFVAIGIVLFFMWFISKIAVEANG